ncbi:aldose 1-epimerase family protein [Thalassoroseus pseudoceratinae]|uniref:aldose 1-epimerase family protein n=1 Tax=Thalassoroseus pseudoceratinae TaxID=2713176 RepID=UPI00141F31FA|nr:aldose 1-epimerase family protein [Thalassoroseus pseudoceratinae]
MNRSKNVLVDVKDGVFLDNWRIDAAEAGQSGNWSVTTRRMRGGLSDGVDVVTLNNGELSIDILPTRGMGIWRGEYQGIRLGWDAPVSLPVHPKFVDLQRRGGIGWLDGFNEWLCRCGLSFLGPPEPEEGTTLHGRISNQPAHQLWLEIDEDARTLAIVGIVEESSLFDARLQLTSRVETSWDSGAISIVDEITNMGGTPADVELLYHINNGPPVLGEGATCVAAFESMAPRDARAAEGISEWNRFAGPEASYTEQAYFFQPIPDDNGMAEVLLKNADNSAGLSVQFDQFSLPYFVLWKNTRAEADGYVCGLEPATCLPNTRTFEREQGRVISLEAGQSRKCRLNLSVHSGAEDVSARVQSINATQQATEPTIHPKPIGNWSP